MVEDPGYLEEEGVYVAESGVFIGAVWYSTYSSCIFVVKGIKEREGELPGILTVDVRLSPRDLHPTIIDLDGCPQGSFQTNKVLFIEDKDYALRTAPDNLRGLVKVGYSFQEEKKQEKVEQMKDKKLMGSGDGLSCATDMGSVEAKEGFIESDSGWVYVAQEGVFVGAVWRSRVNGHIFVVEQIVETLDGSLGILKVDHRISNAELGKDVVNVKSSLSFKREGVVFVEDKNRALELAPRDLKALVERGYSAQTKKIEMEGRYIQIDGNFMQVNGKWAYMAEEGVFVGAVWCSRTNGHIFVVKQIEEIFDGYGVSGITLADHRVDEKDFLEQNSNVHNFNSFLDDACFFIKSKKEALELIPGDLRDLVESGYLSQGEREEGDQEKGEEEDSSTSEEIDRAVGNLQDSWDGQEEEKTLAGVGENICLRGRSMGREHHIHVHLDLDFLTKLFEKFHQHYNGALPQKEFEARTEHPNDKATRQQTDIERLSKEFSFFKKAFFVFALLLCFLLYFRILF